MGAPGRSFVEATHKEFVYDRMDVRVVFITLYSLVFCCCFFGECSLDLWLQQPREGWEEIITEGKSL